MNQKKKIKIEGKAATGQTRPATPLELGLGMRVCDLVTGVVGVVTTKCQNIAGNVRYGVHPPAVGGAPPDPLLYDHLQLEAIERVVTATPVNYDLLKVELGQKAQDSVSGFTGVVVETVEFMNGCIYVTLQPPVDPKKPNVFPDSVGFPAGRVVAVEGKKITVDPEAKKKGGPVVKLGRMAS